MKIGRVSDQTGLSAYTIRYYEKQGLVRRAEKDDSGHRNYNSRDVELLNWVACLKKSGMSLSRIRAYVQAFDAENDAIARGILEEHLVRLEAQKRDILHYIEVTQTKISRLKA